MNEKYTSESVQMEHWLWEQEGRESRLKEVVPLFASAFLMKIGNDGDNNSNKSAYFIPLW